MKVLKEGWAMELNPELDEVMRLGCCVENVLVSVLVSVPVNDTVK